MKRHWPLLSTLLCWVLVFSWPPARRSVATAWENRTTSIWDGIRVDVPPFVGVPSFNATELKAHPHDRGVLLSAALCNPVPENLAALTEIYPNDPFVICMQLDVLLPRLLSRRVPGPLTPARVPLRSAKSSSPKPSSPAEWEAVKALARSGQRLEPNNTFFDWALLYALYASNQDTEAIRVLHRAALKTGFDGHGRNVGLNSLEFYERRFGNPVPADNLVSSQDRVALTKEFQTVARWGGETVMANRKAAKNFQAMEVVLDLFQLNHVRRRMARSFVDISSVNLADEATLFSGLPPANRRVRLPLADAPLSLAQKHPRSIYIYAKTLGRRDVMKRFDVQWLERVKWNLALDKLVDEYYEKSAYSEAMPVAALERLLNISLRTLPISLIFALLFGALSNRFRNRDAKCHGFWLGVVSALGLLALCMIGDAAAVYVRTSQLFGLIGWQIVYLGNEGLELRAASWVLYGVPGAVLCLASACAIRYARAQGPSQPKLMVRLGNVFQQPDDGLARFDFSWMFKLVARLTLWILFLSSLVYVCCNPSLKPLKWSWMVPAVFIPLSLILHSYAWWNGPRRRETLSVSFRLIADTMSGFLVTASVIYAVGFCTLLPRTAQLRNRVKASIQHGEMDEVRVRFGL